MIRLVSFLFSGCWHHWEIIDKSLVEVGDDSCVVQTYDRYILQCKHCGTIKMKNMRPLF